MRRLIYEKASRIKVEIVRIILENRGNLGKEELLNIFNISSATLDKYLLELYLELPSGSIEISKGQIFINQMKCTLYDTQIIYFSKSITKEILYKCFFSSALTLEGLAQELYISSSKLFTALRFLEKQLREVDIEVNRAPVVSITGKAESILILYSLLLHLEEDPYRITFTKLNEKVVVDNIISFFEENHIKVENKVVKEFELWLLAINDRYYLKKMFLNSSKESFLNDFIDSDSPICRSFQKKFPVINFNGFNKEGIILAINCLFFNTVGFHFETAEDEEVFFKSSVKAKFCYQNFILSLLLKEEYCIDSQNLPQTALKIEGSIHYYNLLYPFFYFYEEFFNPKLKESPKFQNLISFFKEDFNSFFQKELGEKVDEEIFEFLAHIVSAFQKDYFSNHSYKIGVYSMKGTIFEKRLCDEIYKAIEILPYSEFKTNESCLDLIIIDDLRLLSNVGNFKKYFLFGDYY
ncbi:MAG: helix-turn-helix domain-containing protein [Enterococcus hulanensis]